MKRAKHDVSSFVGALAACTSAFGALAVPCAFFCPVQYKTVDSGSNDHPVIDYTPPQYITLLLTDLGVLTPSAVSDELIKLYM